MQNAVREDKLLRLKEARSSLRKCWLCNRCVQVNPPCQPQCIACGVPRYMFSFTYRIFHDNGGTASELSQDQLYELALQKLITGGMNNVRDLLKKDVFRQQYRDCEEIKERGEWEFTAKTTKTHLETGTLTARKDVEYSESRGLASPGQGGVNDAATSRSTALSRASGASNASMLSAVSGLVSREASDATLGGLDRRSAGRQRST